MREDGMQVSGAKRKMPIEFDNYVKKGVKAVGNAAHDISVFMSNVVSNGSNVDTFNSTSSSAYTQ